MARVGFLVNNKLTAGTLVGSGGFSTGLPIANALTPRPGEVAAASAGPAPLLLGRFQIQTSGGDGENRKIDVQITSGAFVGVYAVELPIAGEYNADTLAAALQAELRSQTGETTWIVAWVAWGKFAIQANESWVLLGATGASIATNILGELNYPATDVTYAAGDVAFSGTRWGTTAWAHWEVADADFPAALAVLQSSLADDAPTADFSDARVMKYPKRSAKKMICNIFPLAPNAENTFSGTMRRKMSQRF